jgi:hypothetical protein
MKNNSTFTVEILDKNHLANSLNSAFGNMNEDLMKFAFARHAIPIICET